MDFLKGRTNRATYWLTIGILLAMVVLLALVAPKYARVNEALVAIFCIPRLHDIGRSGWWLLIPVALEIAAVVGGIIVLGVDNAAIALGVVVLVFAGLIIWLGCVPGQAQANRFGAPPAPGLAFKKRADPA